MSWPTKATITSDAGAEARNKALLRGTLAHRLLQALPRIAPERREEAARRYLARAATLLTPPERYRAVLSRIYPGRAVRALLVLTEVPDLMEIFGETLDHSMAHLPVMLP